MTKFADWTPEEFQRVKRGTVPRSAESRAPALQQSRGQVNPTDVDWRAQGKTTPVKDQGQCGSCWAFSATAATESRYAIENGLAGADIPILAPQTYVDCVVNP